MYSLYFIGLGLSFLGIIFYKYNRSITNFIAIIVLNIIVAIMVNGDSAVYDLLNYKNSYDRLANGGKIAQNDFGYYYLCNILGKMGLNFDQFRIFIFVVGFILIFSTMIKYTNNLCYFCFFYMLHSMFMDGGQLRNFLAIAVIIFGLKFLIEGGKIGIIKYIICVCVAYLFHAISIVYLSFLLIKLDKKAWKKVIYMIPIVLIILYDGFRKGWLVKLCAQIARKINFSGVEKLESYMLKTARWGFLGPMLVFLAFVIFIVYLNRTRSKRECVYTVEWSLDKNAKLTKKFNRKDIAKFAKMVEYINYVGLFLSMFSVVNVTFYRIFRNICLFDLIFFSSAYETSCNRRRKILIFLANIFLILGWRIWDFHIYFHWEIEKEIFFGIH